MKAFLVTVLSAIAVGLLLIAYGLLAPRAAATSPLVMPDSSAAAAPVLYDPQSGTYQLARPMYASQQVSLPAPYPVPSAPARRVSYVNDVHPSPAPRDVRTAVVRTRGRDWKKTALVIGGSTASGAGLGALVGGKKGALVGAALGGGVSTLWEALRR